MTVHLARRYAFSASHRLHSALLTDEQNRALYGKCNNPHGHGHNYEVELLIAGSVDPVTGRVIDLGDLDRLADEHVIARFRYRNLNEEVAAFQTAVPTTENLAAEVDQRLRVVWESQFGAVGPRLERVSIWETERNICQVSEYA